MNERPWPVVLLTALGAWLAAVPFFLVAAIVLDGTLREPVAALLLGVVMLAGSVSVLRERRTSLFVEQLAVPVMLAALALVTWGLIEPLDWRGTAGAIGLITLGLALVLPQPWMRVLLGAATAQLALLAWSSPAMWRSDLSGLHPWLSLHGLVALWLGALWWSHLAGAGDAATPGQGVRSEVLSDIGAGWVVATLLALAWWSGMTFLLDAQLGQGVLQPQGQLSSWWALRGGGDVGSVVVALAAVVWLVLRWPWLRQPWCIGLGLVLCTLSAFMPALGGVMLVTAACLITRRWRLALWAAMVALWVLGAFYYQLAWPLATKGCVLVAAGAVLVVLAAWGLRGAGVVLAASGGGALPRGSEPGRAWALGFCTLAVVLVANGAIWQKERLIRGGRAVFVALAPVDPRSLMQGDYMALRFATNEETLLRDVASREDVPVRLVFKRDAQGVATPERQHRGEALAPDELIIQMVHKHSRWVLVTDAFYFKEGEAARWAVARYGEFRVDADGQALLVGLRGDRLAPL